MLQISASLEGSDRQPRAPPSGPGLRNLPGLRPPLAPRNALVPPLETKHRLVAILLLPSRGSRWLVQRPTNCRNAALGSCTGQPLRSVVGYLAVHGMTTDSRGLIIVDRETHESRGPPRVCSMCLGAGSPVTAVGSSRSSSRSRGVVGHDGRRVVGRRCRSAQVKVTARVAAELLPRRLVSMLRRGSGCWIAEAPPARASRCAASTTVGFGHSGVSSASGRVVLPDVARRARRPARVPSNPA
jgi:hypothetical protein